MGLSSGRPAGSKKMEGAETVAGLCKCPSPILQLGYSNTHNAHISKSLILLASGNGVGVPPAKIHFISAPLLTQPQQFIV